MILNSGRQCMIELKRDQYWKNRYRDGIIHIKYIMYDFVEYDDLTTNLSQKSYDIRQITSMLNENWQLLPGYGTKLWRAMHE